MKAYRIYLPIIIVLQLLHSASIYSQTNHSSNISTSNTAHAEPLGWLSTGGSMTNDLDIDNNFSSKNINLSTFNGSLQKRMTILSTGLVGIGNFTPAYLLDVDGGDININTATNGLRLVSTVHGSQFVLRNNDIPTSIYSGVFSGNSNNYIHNNTFVGFKTGYNTGNTTPGNDDEGSFNTFVGSWAGYSNDEGRENTFMGYESGYANTGSSTSGYHNTFLGAYAGHDNVIGRSSTLIGWYAGYSNTGDYNTMTGRAAGAYANGEDNSYYGKDAAQSITGIDNCYYGAHAGDDVSSANYNSVYGHNSARYFDGDYNCFFGFRSAWGNGTFLTGSHNCFFGNETNFGNGIGGTPPTDINYSCAIGSKAKVNLDNTIIIGANTAGANNDHIHVGIGLSDDQVYGGPRSELELNTDPAMSVSGVTGSGLQFRQLISTSPNNADTYIEPHGRVLTVDADGKVKLTNGGIGICDDIPHLNYDAGMDLGGNRFYYPGPGMTDNDYDMHNAIGIGYACSSTLPGRLSVDESSWLEGINVSTNAGYFHNGDLTDDWTTPSMAYDKRAVQGVCDGYSGLTDDNNGGTNTGGEFAAANAVLINIGVRGKASYIDNETAGRQGYGGYFTSQFSTLSNVGVYASASDIGSQSNYGIYATVPTSNCTTGTSSDCPLAAGFFNGDVFCTTNTMWVSDLSLKDNIQPLQNAMSKIKLLNPETYTFRSTQFPYMNLPKGQHGGLIAQDVKNLFPELVRTFKLPPRLDSLGHIDTTGTNASFYALDYVGLIPYLISAVKEQQTLIDSLLNGSAAMQSQIDNCCGVGHQLRLGDDGSGDGSTIEIELSDITTIILNQNSPNPFSEETFINYTIPKEVSKAIIMIYDNVGQVLKTVTISSRGEGSLHIYAEGLSSGIYSYSLIADGKTIDTKKMVCQK